MANILFGYKNLCLESGVTFTPSSEAADHDADNLGKAHPSQFWRATTITGTPTVLIDFGRAKMFDLVALLYAKMTPHRQLFKYTSDLRNAAWTKQGLTLSSFSVAELQASGPTVTTAGGETVTGWIVPEDTSTGQHRIYQATISKIEASQSAISFDVYARKYGAATRHLRLLIEGATSGDQATADFNLSTGAVNSSTSIGNFVDIDAAVDSYQDGDGNTVYRCKMICITDGNASLAEARIGILDAAFSGSYTGVADEGLFVWAPKLEMTQWVTTTTVSVDDIGDSFALSEDGRASAWRLYDVVVPSSWPSRFDIDQGTGDPLGNVWAHAPMRADLVELDRDVGFIHSYAKFAAPLVDNRITVYVFDPENADSQIDISNIYIGPSWQPTRNIDERVAWEFDEETGGRVLRLELAWASEADAYAEAMPMALRSGVGTKSSAVADGGQEFRANKKPILVIIDPDETTYAQEQMVYGFLDDVRIRGNRYITDMDGAGTAGLAYSIEMTIKEVLP